MQCMKSKADDLEWRHTPSTSRISAPVKYKDKLMPRTRPCNLVVGVDDKIHSMEPVEYFICYSNGLTSIGVAKQEKLENNQPLTMQFGNWQTTLKPKDLYVGCTVLVKSYYLMSKVQNDKYGLRPIVKENAKHGDLFFKDRLCANTVASDWAIVNKPKLRSTLGTVSDFWCDKDPAQRLLFNAIIYDQEREEEIEVSNDYWPVYVKKRVLKDTPVILNWIQIEEPFLIYPATSLNIQTIFPNRSNLNLKDFEKAEKVKNGIFLGWIDTRYYGSE